MSKLVRRHAHDLHYLLKTTPTIRKAIIEKGDASLICCICECGKNILRGNVPLEPHEKRILRKHKENLRKLVKKSTPVKQKKRIIQKGGFLSAILAPLASLVLPLVSKLFK